MSLVIQGEGESAKCMHTYMRKYKDLCLSPVVSDAYDVTKETEPLRIVNKYYQADVDLETIDFSVKDLSDDNIEGYILITPSNLQKSLDHSDFAYAKHIVEANVGLRLLVSFQEIGANELTSDQAYNYQCWALDHNFEYIQIDKANLCEGHTQREKNGLPRLMEALESNMWSKMTKKIAPSSTIPPVEVKSKESVTSTFSTSNTSISPADQKSRVETVFNLVTHSSSSDNATNTSTSSNNNNTTTSHTTSSSSSSSSSSSTSTSHHINTSLHVTDTSSLLEEENEEEEEGDMDMSQFANLLAQAQQFRAQAASGKLSDSERRSQAALLAMQLSDMMMGGEDSEGEGEGDSD